MDIQIYIHNFQTPKKQFRVCAAPHLQRRRDLINFGRCKLSNVQIWTRQGHEVFGTRSHEWHWFTHCGIFLAPHARTHPMQLSLRQSLSTFQYISSPWREFDPDTAYVACISVSLGFPYMASISLGFPYLVMLQTFKRKRHYSGCGFSMGCYRRYVVPRGRYCDVTMLWPLLVREYARTWAGHLSTPRQREFAAIRGCRSIGNLLNFNAICCIFQLNKSLYIIRRNCMMGQFLCYSL